jgi:hypothetical protein
MAHEPDEQHHFPEGIDTIPQVGLHPSFRAGAHHEIDDVKASTIVGFAVGLVIFTLVVVAALAFAMNLVQVGQDREMARRPLLLENTEGLFPGPYVLNENPVKDGDPILAQDAENVTEYRPAEGDNAARIPVSRAIELLSEKGLPKSGVTSDTKDPLPGDAVRRALENPTPQPAVPADSTPKGP